MYAVVLKCALLGGALQLNRQAVSVSVPVYAPVHVSVSVPVLMPVSVPVLISVSVHLSAPMSVSVPVPVLVTYACGTRAPRNLEDRYKWRGQYSAPH